MEGEKSAVSIKLTRSGFDILMNIKVDSKIEDFFKQASLEGDCADNGGDMEDGVAKTSAKWFDAEGNGLSYYVKNRKLSQLVAGARVIDNFGNGLVEDDKINLAFLRIVGISKGVTVKTTDLLSVEEMKDYIQRLANWTKEFYQNHLVDTEVLAEINVPAGSETLATAS
jgi:hypothetical protein